MALPKSCFSLGRNPDDFALRTPGTLGINDAATPVSRGLTGTDTPGPVGTCNTTADAAFGTLPGLSRLHISIAPDRNLIFWDYDPSHLLENDWLDPAFVRAAHRMLSKARLDGLRPQVHEAYRTPERSDELNAAYRAKIARGESAPYAAPAWHSCHNYGIAMDVWLYDRKGKLIDNKVRGWYPLYKMLGKVSIATGFVWGENFHGGDSDHFEFHPKWAGGAPGATLLKMKGWAESAAVAQPTQGVLPGNAAGPVPEPKLEEWLSAFWWASGGDGQQPPADFLAAHPPPTFAAERSR